MRNLEEQAAEIFNSLKVANREQASELFAKFSPKEFVAWYYGVLSEQIGKLDTTFRKKVFAYIEKERGSPIGAEESRKEILDNNPVYRAVMDSGLQLIYQKMDELAQYPEFIEKMAAYRQVLKEEQIEKDLHVTIEGVHYRAKQIIPVLWKGWEMDNIAWLIEVDGKLKLATSSHGVPMWAHSSFLEEKLKEYEEVVAATESAFNLLKDISNE